MSIRLNKLLADRGVAARRKCDALIESGVVRVNGRVVREPGHRVTPDVDDVEIGGRPLPQAEGRVYYAFHKPVGVISTLADPHGRRTLAGFLPPGARLFPVGRLDADTSGLLLLTNDGELAHHLMHPRYGVSKFYRVHVDRPPHENALRRLREGVMFEPGVRSAPARVRVLGESGGETAIEIVLQEGRYRQVRRMCEAVGLEVRRLHRWAYGPLRLAGLERGRWRRLTDEEVRTLRAAAARPKARPAGLSRPSRRRGSGLAGEPEARPPRYARLEYAPAAAPPPAAPSRRDRGAGSAGAGQRASRPASRRPSSEPPRGRAVSNRPSLRPARPGPGAGPAGRGPIRGRRRPTAAPAGPRPRRGAGRAGPGPRQGPASGPSRPRRTGRPGQTPQRRRPPR